MTIAFFTEHKSFPKQKLKIQHHKQQRKHKNKESRAEYRTGPINECIRILS